MRDDSTNDGADEEQSRGSGAAVALNIVPGKEVLVREQIAVDAGQHDAGEGVVLEGAAGDGLAAALEGDEGQRQQDVPADASAIALGIGRGDGHDDGGSHGEGELRREGGDQHPAPLGREVPVEAGEEERAHAEGQQRDARLEQAWRGGREGERCQSETDIDGVAWFGTLFVSSSSTRA